MIIFTTFWGEAISSRMTRKVDNQRSRRERARAIKEEKRRKGRMRVDRSRATRSPNDAEDPMTIYGSEQEENDGNVMDEPKWNVGDHVVVEDSRVGASRKLFWEVLAVVKSREYVSGEWHYCVDDLDYETKFLYRVPERRLSHSKYSRRIQHGIREQMVCRDRKPFAYTFSTVFLTLTMLDLPTLINFALPISE